MTAQIEDVMALLSSEAVPAVLQGLDLLSNDRVALGRVTQGLGAHIRFEVDDGYLSMTGDRPDGWPKDSWETVASCLAFQNGLLVDMLAESNGCLQIKKWYLENFEN